MIILKSQVKQQVSHSYECLQSLHTPVDSFYFAMISNSNNIN